MKRLEDELKNALRRQEPPEGFANRTLLKISESRPRTRFSLFHGCGLRWAFAGIVLLLLAAGAGAYYQAREEQRRGKEAKEQLMLALRIAGGKLQIVQARVWQTNLNYQEQE